MDDKFFVFGIDFAKPNTNDFTVLVEHNFLNQPIGDRDCKHNAQSLHLRCAVNPCGPCEGCSFFEPKKF